jgi:RimJ/RimL family protein N-acetyltransferase
MSVAPFPDTDASTVLKVRSWRPRDADAFREVVSANVEHLEVFDWPSESLEARVAQIRNNAHTLTYSLGIFDPRGIVGEVEANCNRDGTYALVYWLAKSATGKGYARLAVSAVVSALFAITDASSIHASVERDNARSLKLLHALGFCRLGPDSVPLHDAYVLTRHAYTGGIMLPPQSRISSD